MTWDGGDWTGKVREKPRHPSACSRSPPCMTPGAALWRSAVPLTGLSLVSASLSVSAHLFLLPVASCPPLHVALLLLLSPPNARTTASPFQGPSNSYWPWDSVCISQSNCGEWVGCDHPISLAGASGASQALCWPVLGLGDLVVATPGLISCGRRERGGPRAQNRELPRTRNSLGHFLTRDSRPC